MTTGSHFLGFFTLGTVYVGNPKVLVMDTQMIRTMALSQLPPLSPALLT